MGDNTKIEWTDKTWNPTVGCSIVSPGCTNCYAMKMAERLESMATKPDGSGIVGPCDDGYYWITFIMQKARIEAVLK